MGIRWNDIPKSPEEDEFQKEYVNTHKEETSQKTKGEGASDSQHAASDGFDKKTKNDEKAESIGLAGMIEEGWNEIAVPKGYEPVVEKQSAFLEKHTRRFEEKYLGKYTNVIPELETLIAHAIVYVPKWARKRRADTKDKKK